MHSIDQVGRDSRAPERLSPTLSDVAAAAPQPASAVMSYTEWDPLEEIIVGQLEGATIPSKHAAVTVNMPSQAARLYPFFAGRKYPKWMIRLAQAELDCFIAALEGEGVRVRRPE